MGHSETMPRRKVLIVHQNFPGQFRHVARHLASRADVQLICFGGRSAPGLPDVELRRYRLHREASPKMHLYLREMEGAVLRGQAFARELERLVADGFTPDLILAHPGWGETMYAKDILPQTRLVHFCEWYYGTPEADLNFDPEFPTRIDARLRARTWNALHGLNLELCDLGISPTQWQRSRHPKAWQSKIEVCHEGVDTQEFRPDPGATLKLPDGTLLRAGQPIVTYVARNLEPYRGFHKFMRALEVVQREHRACHAVIVGGDGVSYGRSPRDASSWREWMLREVKLDPLRTHFTGLLPRNTYRKLLQVSAVHVYLTYPFVLSWSMLEAMASGCLLVASDTAPVQEFVSNAVNGLLAPFHDTQALASQVLEGLEMGAARRASLCLAARETVVHRCDFRRGLQGVLAACRLPVAKSLAQLEVAEPAAVRSEDR